MKSLPDKGTREHRKKVGQLGETVACRFLMKQGFKIIERNYLKKWGEIDIVATKGEVWHFVEVKTVSRENPFLVNQTGVTISHGTSADDPGGFRAEDNLHPWKLKRFTRTVETYIAEKDLDDADWQIDAITVKLWLGEKKAKVRFMENVL